MTTYSNGHERRIVLDPLPSPSITLDGSNDGRQVEFERTLLIIDSRALDRECFAQSLSAHGIGMNIFHFGSIQEFAAVRSQTPAVSSILLNVGGKRISDPVVADEIRKLVADVGQTPVILLADTDELSQILQALEYGVRGFHPHIGRDRRVHRSDRPGFAGGVFVPASSVLAMRRIIETGGDARPLAGMFTLRQAEVVEALRRGKANKIIAFELNLRESTVKVHIRNIMRKLKATNRTEVAFKINDMFPNYDPPAKQQTARPG